MYGFAIRHAAGTVECSVDCGADDRFHEDAIDCAELARGCGCEERAAG